MNSVYKNEHQRKRARSRETSKIRVIAVYRMILENEQINAKQIKQKLLKEFGIECDKKTIYSDIASIDRFITIEVRMGYEGGYRKLNFNEEEIK